jgi:uncharacterized protein YhbP (UPF0306 family)
VGIERSKRSVAAGRMAKTARRLLDASSLCAIATVAPSGRAHVNTAYFAWSPDFEVVWLSEPRAKHSRNIRSNDGVAIAVYDSGQTWSEPDRGLQLFGTARDLEPSAARDAQKLYAARFAAYDETEQSAYRFYVLRPHRLKLFDERELGAGMFVTARVLRGGRLVWERTEIYSSTK